MTKTLREANRDLRKTRLALEKDAERLREEIASLEGQRGYYLELRGLHADVDSIKHMMRSIHGMVLGLFGRVDIKPTETDRIVDPSKEDVDKILNDVRGKFEG